MGLILSIFVSLGSAHAWTINTNDSGSELNWAETQIGWTLNTTGDHALDLALLDRAISDAAGQWNEVEDSRVELSFLGATTVAAADYTDGQNTIYFEREWTLDSSLLAVTYVWSLEDGTISAFDMAVNTANHIWSTDAAMDANDLHNTISHEFGHALGLAHSELDYATMYESTFEGETEKRDISTDDEHGMRYLYGSSAYEPELAEPLGGCSTVSQPAKLWAGLMLLPALLLRRRA